MKQEICLGIGQKSKRGMIREVRVGAHMPAIDHACSRLAKIKHAPLAMLLFAFYSCKSSVELVPEFSECVKPGRDVHIYAC